jgi:hypothetical protein
MLVAAANVCARVGRYSGLSFDVTRESEQQAHLARVEWIVAVLQHVLYLPPHCEAKEEEPIHQEYWPAMDRAINEQQDQLGIRCTSTSASHVSLTSLTCPPCIQ